MNSNQLSQLYRKVDTLNYRDCQIDFWEDTVSSQIFCIWENERLDFGLHNINYLDDCKALIDQKLDTISRFPEFRSLLGCKLQWFQNGDYRDIKLTHRGRILKIWIVTAESRLNMERVLDEARTVLEKLPPDLY